MDPTTHISLYKHDQDGSGHTGWFLRYCGGFCRGLLHVRCGCTERDRIRLNKLVRRASLDCPLDPTEEVAERRMLAKLNSIMDNTSQPRHDTVGAMSSSFSSRRLPPQLKVLHSHGCPTPQHHPEWQKNTALVFLMSPYRYDLQYF